MAIAHELRLRGASHPGGWKSWGGTLARSLYAGVLVGTICGFLTMVISLFSIILGKVIFDRILIDPPFIYREIAPAVAVLMAIVTFAGNAIWERTHPAPAPAQRT